MGRFRAGDTAFIVESNNFIKEGVIASCSGGIYLFKYPGGGIRVKEGRLFATKVEAQKEIDKYKPKPKQWPYGE